MTGNQSLLTRFTRTIEYVGSILSQIDLDVTDRQQVKLVGTIKHLLADARLDIRDWELAENRQEMQRYAREALQRIEQARASMLLASEHGVFSAIQVAEITAQLDMAESELRS